MRLFQFLPLLSAYGVFGSRIYNIVNNCPLSINLFINGQSEGSLASYGGTTSRTVSDTWSGFIYTDFNRGNQDGAGTVRAGFFGDVSFDRHSRPCDE